MLSSFSRHYSIYETYESREAIRFRKRKRFSQIEWFCSHRDSYCEHNDEHDEVERSSVSPLHVPHSLALSLRTYVSSTVIRTVGIVAEKNDWLVWVC